MSTKIDGKITARARMQRYRATHRRIDYVPSPDALAAIEKRMAGQSNCMAGVIDGLILAGNKALPEAQKR